MKRIECKKQLLQESKSKINIVLERKAENAELFPVEKLEPMNLAKEEIEQIYEGKKGNIMLENQ